MARVLASSRKLRGISLHIMSIMMELLPRPELIPGGLIMKILKEGEEQAVRWLIEEIKEGRASVKALKDYDPALVSKVATKLRRERKIDPDTYIKICLLYTSPSPRDRG